MQAVDHWLDINGLDDDRPRAKIAADGIDILVDLNGYTKDARTKVFARRPAPIIVNWFGFPGTMGTPYHHYIIADDDDHPAARRDLLLREGAAAAVLPAERPQAHRRRRARRRAPRPACRRTRSSSARLNGTQKITPRTFARWMAILGRVPDSVLWLLSGTATEANERLRKAPPTRGVARQRLVFAEKMPNPDHLARYPLADLFLDSMPYGAHTTASDSLWMGVPMLTLSGPQLRRRASAPAWCGPRASAELDCSIAGGLRRRARSNTAQNREKLAAHQGEAGGRPRHLRAVRHAQAGPPSGRPLSADVERLSGTARCRSPTCAISTSITRSGLSSNSRTWTR